MGILSRFKRRRRREQFARTFQQLHGAIQPDFGVLSHHLGLGDNIICNGIVRTLYPSFKILVLPVKAENVVAVRWMFGDLPNIRILPVKEADEPGLVADAFDRAGARSIRIGLFDPRWREEMLSYFDAAFYELAGIPFEARWAAFKVPRDVGAEERVFQAVAPAGPYIFVHDDADRGFGIDEQRLPRNLARVRPRRGLTDVLFHYRKVIEGAAEVHCISSSFAHFLECAPSGRPQFLHRYPREDGTWSTWRNFQVLE
jgi:hypothetical protein